MTTENGVPCFCGKTFKNQFYLGKHVAQTDDPQHNPPKPDISDSIESNYSGSQAATADNSGEEQDDSRVSSSSPASSNSSGGIELETVEQESQSQESDWRELNPEAPREMELIRQGYEEINLDSERVR